MVNTMKLITWNCNGSFRTKYQSFNDDFDILVVQECEDPKNSIIQYQNWAFHYLWKGKSKNKGIGIFFKDSYDVQPLDWSDINTNYKNEELESFLPCLVNNEYILIAIWTKKANSEVFGYIGQLWKYLQLHKSKLLNKKVILIGDFNSNTIWDKWDRWWNHSDVVQELKDLKIVSLYHTLTNEKQGEEATPTFYLQRKTSKPYHIDYIFLSEELITNDTKMRIGNLETWLQVSDHMPIFLDL